MKVFIKEYCRDVTIRIFGMDNEERTKEFFDKYFYDVDGVEIMTDDERSEYLSEAEYSIEKAAQFEYFAQHIGAIQTAIDLVAVAHIYGRDNYLNEENYIV
ncbi:MAG: hypothetical protein J6K17_04100 [Oscillospiraceae bacterium]|nr:hypothetical protein [Oscillospiraceae bacterium]MBQ7793680.1 hypothetical protein [Clostridia bacterium]MBQ8787103.1 hypothetical protein [Oscillospiraceae bacterium]MBQ8902759.1 hypothetical protein [Oscillospiraceae bacterium]